MTHKSELIPAWHSTKIDYHEMFSTFLAAKKLQLHKLQEVTRNAMKYMRKPFEEQDYLVTNEEILQDMDVLTCDTFPGEMNCNQFRQSINEAFYDALDDDDDIIPPTPQKRMMMNHRTKVSRLLRNQKGKSTATTAVCVVKY